MTPAFAAAYAAGRGALAAATDVADLQTPVAAFLKLAHGQPNSFLLESVEGGASRGRYSIIGMAPDLMWRVRRRPRGGQPSRAVRAARLRGGRRARRWRACAPWWRSRR